MSDSDDSDDSRGRGGGIGGFKNNMEEFKMHEDDDEDHVDLLAEKKRFGDLNQFYQQEELDNLKDQIKFNMPNMNNIQSGN